MNEIASDKIKPVATDRANDWGKRTEGFLETLGKSYVIRFRSDAGMSPITMGGDNEHNGYWVAINTRVTRLHEFSAEFFDK
jgi:hypothetical protein